MSYLEILHRDFPLGPELRMGPDVEVGRGTRARGGS